MGDLAGSLSVPSFWRRGRNPISSSAGSEYGEGGMVSDGMQFDPLPFSRLFSLSDFLIEAASGGRGEKNLWYGVIAVGAVSCWIKFSPVPRS